VQVANVVPLPAAVPGVPPAFAQVSPQDAVEQFTDEQDAAVIASGYATAAVNTTCVPLLNEALPEVGVPE